MNNYVQPGKRLTVLAPYQRNAGQAGKVASLFGVFVDTVASGSSGVMDTEGVFDITKGTFAFALGTDVYWDDTAKSCTTVSTGGTLLVGVATATSGVSDTNVRVKLHI